MTFHKVLLFQLNIAPVNSCITANLLKFKIRKHKVTTINLKIVMTSIHFLYYIQNISQSHHSLTADKNLVERKPMSHDSNTSIFFDSAASTSSKTGEEQLVSERRPKSSNCLSNWRRYKYSSSPLFLRDSLISSQIFSKSSSSSSLMMAWTVSFRAHALWRIWRSGDNTHTHTLLSTVTVFMVKLLYHPHQFYLRGPCLGCTQERSVRWDPCLPGTLWLSYIGGGQSWRELLTSP